MYVYVYYFYKYTLAYSLELHIFCLLKINVYEGFLILPQIFINFLLFVYIWKMIFIKRF